MPVVVIGGIYGGIFTPTEASAVAVFYALVVGACYRELKLADLMPVLRQSVVSTAAVMLIISAAALFSFLISRSGLPAQVAAGVTAMFESPWAFCWPLTPCCLWWECLLRPVQPSWYWPRS